MGLVNDTLPIEHLSKIAFDVDREIDLIERFETLEQVDPKDYTAVIQGPGTPYKASD